MLGISRNLRDEFEEEADDNQEEADYTEELIDRMEQCVHLCEKSERYEVMLEVIFIVSVCINSISIYKFI